MRKSIIFLSLCVAAAMSAQGRRDGQEAIAASYGFMPSKSNSKTGNEFTATFGYLKVFGRDGWLLKADAVYQKSHFNYLGNQSLSLENYGINIQGGWTYEGLKPIYLQAYGGIFAAYQKANNGNDRDPLYGAKLSTKVNGPTYGLSGTAEVEIAIISTKLSLLGNYTQFYDLHSKFSKESYALFAGIRLYLN